MKFLKFIANVNQWHPFKSKVNLLLSEMKLGACGQIGFGGQVGGFGVVVVNNPNKLRRGRIQRRPSAVHSAFCWPPTVGFRLAKSVTFLK